MAIMTKDDGGAKVAQRSNVPQCNASALDPMQHKLIQSVRDLDRQSVYLGAG